jgi:23S rRNA (adenine2503-C2)-methyltransferase
VRRAPSGARTAGDGWSDRSRTPGTQFPAAPHPGVQLPPQSARSRLAPLPPPPVWGGPVGPDGQPLADLKGMLPSELESLMVSWGEPGYRGRQLFSWLYAAEATSFDSATALPLSLRERLAAQATLRVAELVERRADPVDGTVKYLFRLGDGQTVETVLMRYRHGYTACVSSQVGCRMGCRFCASTLGGLQRNLAASEMVEQVAALNRDLADPRRRHDRALFPVPADREEDDAHRGGSGGDRFDRVSRIVVMGMGEPLENLDALLTFLRVVHEADGPGIGWRHMTVSTSGLVPGIDALAAADLPITLAVSLHAPNDELRDTLVPVNRRFPLRELLAACRRYVARTHRRITFEYVMIGGVNDLPEHARELGRLVRDFPAHVNLIPLNPVPERDLEPSPPEAVARFRQLLAGAGVQCTVRRQLGVSIDAACGQLRRRRQLRGGSVEEPMPAP